MLSSRKLSLKSIISSENGIHLTVYIKKSENLKDCRKHFREAIDAANEYLMPVMAAEARVQFLAPVVKLSKDNDLLKKFNGNIGVFRTEDSFRVLNLPVELESMCTVATSFHVKPLLKWLQTDREFLLLGVEEKMISLYHGTLQSLELIDSLFTDKVEHLNEWIKGLTKSNKPRLYIAGDPDLVRPMIKGIKYSNIERTPVRSHFSRKSVGQITADIKEDIRKDARDHLERSIVEFYWAEDLNLAKKNIFQIGRAAIKGTIRKLIVAEGIHIFGKLDKKTGGMSIHPVDMDHEDDDLLDDLAQTVIAQGGEVIVAPREQIPKGRPLLAILKDNQDDSLETYSNAFEMTKII
jgi:hypothetical protein